MMRSHMTNLIAAIVGVEFIADDGVALIEVVTKVAVMKTVTMVALTMKPPSWP